MMASVRPSKARVEAMVKAASVASGVSVADILHRRYVEAVKVRWGIWRELHDLGFGYAAIGATWGVDHTSVRWGVIRTAPVETGRLAA